MKMLDQKKLDDGLAAAQEEIKFLMDHCTDGVTADRLQDVLIRIRGLRSLSSDPQPMTAWQRGELTKLVTRSRFKSAIAG